VSAGSDVQVQAYYDRTYLLGPQIGESRHTVDVDFTHHLARGRQRIIWGAGARVSPGSIIQTVPTLDVSPHDRTNSVYSVFAQDELALVQRHLWFTVGSKFERNNYTGLEIQPNVRLLWTPTDRQSAWAGVTRSVRTPSRLEEDVQLTGFLAARPPTFVRITGNPNFESERLIGYEAGYRKVLMPQLYVDVSAFHNHHDNLQSLGSPSVVTETSPLPVHVLLVFPYANGVMGSSDGVEISPDWQPTRAWQLKGSYSYLYINLENKPGNSDTSAVASYEGSSPRHQAFVRSTLTLPRDWQLDQTLRYVSALPAQQVGAYVTLDLRVSWPVAKHLTLSVAGQNLTDDHHDEFGHSPPPAVGLRRSVYATVTWTR
jgi:iron complex outermembrane receptor protein